MGYIYDTHVHTSESSACAKLSGSEQARNYKERGYTGIIITDHFFNGNTTVPQKASWEERVTLFCKGYEEAVAGMVFETLLGSALDYVQQVVVYGKGQCLTEWKRSHNEKYKQM